MRVDVAHDARATLGEGPVWDERSGRLHWVDISAGIVHRFAVIDGSDLPLEIGQPVGALGLGDRGGLILAIRDGFGLVEADSSRIGRVIEIETDLRANRMNDGGCDPAGRFWAGTMAADHTPEAGSLYRVDGSGGSFEVARILEGLTIANGIDWSPDGRSLYYVDSSTQRIDIFDFDAGRGTIDDRRPFAAIPSSDGLPDGLTVDAEGGVWVALFGTGRVRRYDPTGRPSMELTLPVSLVTSMAFGGSDLADLYITTARHRLTPRERRRQTHAGSVFVCRPGPIGSPARRFQGI
jgi:sugar lactone lactonase YvrE